jgi:hypothetical protein
LIKNIYSKFLIEKGRVKTLPENRLSSLSLNMIGESLITLETQETDFILTIPHKNRFPKGLSTGFVIKIIV